MRRSLARTLIDIGNPADAEKEIPALMTTIATTADIGSLPPVLAILGTLGAWEHRFDDAEAAYRKAINILEEEQAGSPSTGLTIAGLARVQAAAGRIDEARLSFGEGIALMEAGWGPKDPDLLRAMNGVEALQAGIR